MWSLSRLELDWLRKAMGLRWFQLTLLMSSLWRSWYTKTNSRETGMNFAMPPSAVWFHSCQSWNAVPPKTARAQHGTIWKNFHFVIPFSTFGEDNSLEQVSNRVLHQKQKSSQCASASHSASLKHFWQPAAHQVLIASLELLTEKRSWICTQ